MCAVLVHLRATYTNNSSSHGIHEATDQRDLFYDPGLNHSPRPIYLISDRVNVEELHLWYQQLLQDGQAALVDLA